MTLVACTYGALSAIGLFSHCRLDLKNIPDSKVPYCKSIHFLAYHLPTTSEGLWEQPHLKETPTGIYAHQYLLPDLTSGSRTSNSVATQGLVEFVKREPGLLHVRITQSNDLLIQCLKSTNSGNSTNIESLAGLLDCRKSVGTLCPNSCRPNVWNTDRSDGHK